MKNSSTVRPLHLLVMLACLSLASQVFAYSTHRQSSPSYREVKFEIMPTATFFGVLNSSTPIVTGTLLVPVQTLTLRSRQSGGDHGGHGDDTTGGDDTTNGGGGHGGDSTDDNGGGNHGDGNGDSTNTDGGGHHGDDSTGTGTDSTDDHGHHGGGDTTNHGGDGHHGDDSTGHDRNDTLECGGHGHHDGHGGTDDSLEVEDSSSRSMFNGGHQSIVIKTSGSKTFVTFNFTNDMTTPVAVTGLALTSGTNFSIASAMPTAAHPINLPAGAKIAVKVAFIATDAKSHTDQLQIVTTGSTTPSVVSLEGINTNPAASVSNILPTGVSVSMTPNPMSSILKINVNGARNASVAIYDMLGKQIFTQQIGSNFQWNGYSNDNVQLANGTFIARLSGESTEGKAFVISQKIMLQR